MILTIINIRRFITCLERHVFRNHFTSNLTGNFQFPQIPQFKFNNDSVVLNFLQKKCDKSDTMSNVYLSET